jgi:E3 ubiquitin-protein ligase HERC4
LYTFGSNDVGQLGRSGSGLSVLPIRTIMDTSGSPVDLVHVSCGAFFTFVLARDGTLYGWGSNSSGQLGTGSPKQFSLLPRRVSLENVTHVACGVSHVVACTSNGSVYAWGSNLFGELGISSPLESKSVQQQYPRPTLVSKFPDHTTITTVACGPYSSTACSLSGDAYVWGLLSAVNFTNHQWVPRRMERLHEQFIYIARAACGTSHMVFMSDLLSTKAVKVLAGACKYEGAFNLLQVCRRIFVQRPPASLTTKCTHWLLFVVHDNR